MSKRARPGFIFLCFLAGYMTFSAVGYSQEQTKVLYVANLNSPSENALLNHLSVLEALIITVLSDFEMYAGYDFGQYDLVIIADTSPAISDNALEEMADCETPIFAIVSLKNGSYADRLYLRAENTSNVEYSAYSTQKTYIKNNVTVENGLVGSAGTTNIGGGVNIYSNVESVGAIHLSDNIYIDGDVLSASSISQDDENTITITGNITQYGNVVPKSIPTRNVTYTGEHVKVYGGQHRLLPPGQYAGLEAFDGATITLSAGDYSFGSFVLQAGNIALEIDANGGTAQIGVQNELRFGDRNMIGVSGSGFIAFYTNYSGQIKIGTDSVFYGSVTAPNGQIYVFSRSELHGSLGGREVWVDTDSSVVGLDSGVMTSGKAIYMYNSCHPVTFASDLAFDAYANDTVVTHGTSFDNLYSGISVLVVDEDHHAVILLDDYHKVVASSLHKTEVYTLESWVVFDQILNYLAPMGLGWDSYERAWDSVVESRILDYLDAVTADPYLYDYNEAVEETWRLLAGEDLAFLRYWTISRLRWLLNQGGNPSLEPFDIYDAATLQQYMDGDFELDPSDSCTCPEGCDSARTSAGTLTTESAVCYEISSGINGWNAWELGGRIIEVNGVMISPGASLPSPIEGKYYFYFSAGAPSWTGWTYW